MSVGGNLVKLIETLEGNPSMDDEEFLELVEKYFDKQLREEVQTILEEQDILTRDTAVNRALNRREDEKNEE